MIQIRPLAIAAGLLALLLNPGLGCGEDFDFGEAEMRRAVEGTYDLTLPGEAAPRATFTLSFGKGDMTLVQQAQCSTRSFVASAGACSSTTTMNFNGTVVAGIDTYKGRKVTGFFNVQGYQYRGGQLHVVFEHGPRLVARVTETNTLADVSLTESTSSPQPAMLLRRP